MPRGMGQGRVVDGRFEIERLVAQGGMGTVYRARDRETGGLVALKVIASHLREPVSAERFARETSLLAQIRAPRVVAYVGHGTTSDGQYYLAMQWLEGEDLRAMLARGKLALGDARRVLEGAAEALAAVHAQGVVHRDLKPGNLFLRGGSCADLVLLDFGIARRAEVSRRLTASGTLLGTPHYMAPEQASDGAAIQPATDVFSLGCIFYQCLTGECPFDAAHVAGVLARILFDAPRPVQRLRPSVPEPWAELLGRMLHKNPARRPQDAAALRREIALLPWPDENPEPAAAPSSRAQISFSEEERGGEQTRVTVLLALLAHATPTRPDETEEAWMPGSPDVHNEARRALVRFGFAVEALADGSLLATLPSSGAATDQARIAARGALHLREAWPGAQVAVATGRAVLGQTTRVGEAVDRAARLLALGRAAQDADGAWIDKVTAGLLDARFVTSPGERGVLLRAERPDTDESRLLLGKPSPCVGREVEIERLEGLLSRVVEENVAQAALVLGPPGVGKTRLRHELARRIGERHPEAAILVGHGDPLTAGSPYGLVGDALRRRAGIRVGDDAAAARAALVTRLCARIPPRDARHAAEFLGELCGIPFPAEDSPELQAAWSDPRVMSEQIGHAFLQWLAAECADKPVVLFLEDLQWGDALTVKLVELALRERDNTPFFILAFGRPEVLETFRRPLFRRMQEIALRPLGRRASERLVKSALGDSVEGETLARIVTLAQGNALFLEELIRAAAEGAAWEVPETVLAMLQARLARLAPEVRRALRAASVLGEVFWRGGVRALCEAWCASGEIDRWLGQLVDIELVEQRRGSRFPDEDEYNFRHALVRDAAYGLLTEVDRRAGHRAAGLWLEEMGEADAMALAGHAEEARDPERAIHFHTLAAEQSLGQDDLAGAVARATRGIARGAGGQALGVLQSIRAVALHGMGSWAEACDAGVQALELLPRGSRWWCRAAEKLLHALPQVGQVERAERLFDETLRTEPAEEARAAYVHALSSVILGLTIVGARARAESCIEMVNRVGAALFARSAHARGAALLWHGYFIYVLEPDPHGASVLLERGRRALAEARVHSHLSMAQAVLGVTLAELGDRAGADEASRSAITVAEELGDGYALANAWFYRGVRLTQGDQKDDLDEAELLAEKTLEANISPSYEGCARWVLARAAVAKRDFARAEREARRAAEVLAMAPSYVIATATCLLRALAGQGRGEEAARVARDNLAVLRRAGGAGFAEVGFLVAAASALDLAGARAEALSTLRAALGQIELRASRMPEAARDRYGRENEECRRALALARAWGA